MGKQKFYCKGVERASGRRVAVTLVADNQESAVRIAKEHGVLVESVALAPQDPKPTPERRPVAPSAVEDADEDVSGLLDSPDEEAEALELGAEPVKPTSPSAPATKTCPYCGELVLAVAIRCKHCGSYLSDKRQVAAGPAEDAAAGPATLPWLWIAVAAAAGVAVIVVVVGILVFWGALSRTSVAPLPEFRVAAPTRPAPAPVAQSVATKQAAPKVSPEEREYAAKLAAFLDAFDATTRLLETGPKPGEYRKQHDAMKALYAAIPAPPQGAAWTAEAAASSKQLFDLTEMLNGSLTTLDEAMQGSGDRPEARDAFRQAAAQMGSISAAVRSLIPPACLAK